MFSFTFAFQGTFSAELVEQLSKTIGTALRDFEFEFFALGCSYPYSLSEDEKALVKKEFQFALVKQLEKELGKKADFDQPTVVLTLDFNSRRILIEIKSLYLEGRYNKYSREIAQTIFYCPQCKGRGCKHCDFKGKLGLETVEELTGNPAKAFCKATGFAFHGAGREDVDVQMLGAGRRFVLEILEPKKRSIVLEELEKKINSEANEKIVVHLSSFVSKKRVAEVKEERHFKKYLALVECEKNFVATKLMGLLNRKIVVQQQTPGRVLARRSDIVRERKVTILSVEPTTKTEFEIVLLAEAGLYVKEFISGENGRTKPSLGTLLENICVCKQLDVLEIIES